jgi:hypothetical protein
MVARSGCFVFFRFHWRQQAYHALRTLHFLRQTLTDAGSSSREATEICPNGRRTPSSRCSLSCLDRELQPVSAHHLCATHHFPIADHAARSFLAMGCFPSRTARTPSERRSGRPLGHADGHTVKPAATHVRLAKLLTIGAPQHSTSSRGSCERSISFMSCVPLSGFFHTSCSTGISEPVPRITGSTNVRSGIRDIDCDHNHVFSTSHNPHYGSNGS